MSDVTGPSLLDLMRSRRSVRSFWPDPLPDGSLGLLLEAMRWAPSAGNVQPWLFVAVKEPGLRAGLAAAAYGQQLLEEAPLVIAVCVDRSRARESYGDRGVNLYCLQDTAAATQNLLLVAHALGLGACWVGAFDEREVSRLLGLAPDERPVALVPVGIPAEQPNGPGRRPLDEVSRER